MVDLTRDEWDDMQGFEGDDGIPMHWQCDYCKCWTETPIFEEGDLIECEACNIKLDAREYYFEFNNRSIDVNFDVWDCLAEVAQRAILRNLSKG